MDRTQKWMGSVGCLGQIENIKRQSLITFMSTQVFCYLEKERYLIYSLPILLFGLSILFITLKLTLI